MKPIAVLDLETDPFEHGVMIQPFVAGFYDGSTFSSFWSLDCVDKLVAYLATLPPLCIYAHNGGRFDFFYFLRHLHYDVRIVNSRIIQAKLGHHELRDSFAIMPFALETYKKTPIDYATFKSNVREQHRETITSYLRDDCVDLYELCMRYRKEFGDVLTIGSASMRELKKHHTFKCGNDTYDKRLRSMFYFGGRNQVFRPGITKGDVKIYDVNSMYPYVMQNYLHPVSTGIHQGRSIDSKTAFLTVEGDNDGAFPTRLKDSSLDFTKQNGVFHTSIHEFEAALETGTFRPKRIVKTYGFSERHSFADFVTHFYDARSKAKESGDKILTIFYKFVLNSAYGKFAQNPENYSEFWITEIGELPTNWHECDKTCAEICRHVWTPCFQCNDYFIWKRPVQELTFYNVATGASITAAARAHLLRGLSHAGNPYYCDTDSIMCESLTGVPISETTLGAWKLETQGNLAAICGKKLYAIFQGEQCVKKAHKGARLTGPEIVRIAKGEQIEYHNPVPAFKFDGSWSFTSRTIRSTGVPR
jgi:DNA polymerase type B, organellar and viral